MGLRHYYLADRSIRETRWEGLRASPTGKGLTEWNGLGRNIVFLKNACLVHRYQNKQIDKQFKLKNKNFKRSPHALDIQRSALLGYAFIANFRFRLPEDGAYIYRVEVVTFSVSNLPTPASTSQIFTENSMGLTTPPGNLLDGTLADPLGDVGLLGKDNDPLRDVGGGERFIE